MISPGVAPRDGTITVITTDRSQAHNAVDHATAADLADASRRFGADDDAAVLARAAIVLAHTRGPRVRPSARSANAHAVAGWLLERLRD